MALSREPHLFTTFQGNGSQTLEPQGATEMPPCIDEETESREGTFLPRGIQTFQGGAWRTASSLALGPDTPSRFPPRSLLRFLSEPFLARSSFSRLILGLPCHSVAMVAEPFDLSTRSPVGLLSFFHQTAPSSQLISQTLLCQTQHGG